MLYPHQEEFLRSNPDKALLAYEAGCGKSYVAAHWLEKRDATNALVVCPKQIQSDWKKRTSATVLTKEQFAKLDTRLFNAPSALVVDEADEFASPLFWKGRSQRTKALYEFIRANPTMPVLLLTATPVRSNPANLHTLLCFIGVYYPWAKWRDHFYSLEMRPYLPRPAWMPRRDWRTRIQPFIEKHCKIALLHDIVTDTPEEQHEVLPVPTPAVRSLDPEPMRRFTEEHRAEQVCKAKEIQRIGRGYRKVFVVAHYREQIEALEKELGKERQVYVLHGGVADQGAVIRAAQEDPECYFIVQASIGAGFDADSFSCMIFASMSYKVRDYVQMKARIKRIHNLHPVHYYYFIGGERDQAIYDTVQQGLDFVPSEWLARPTARQAA
jgi:hypothetical protein